MSTQAPPKDHKNGMRPATLKDRPRPGYDQWLAEEIEAGIDELDAGKGIPADEVWKKLGLE